MSQAPAWFTNAINQKAQKLRVGPKGKQLAVRYWPAQPDATGPALVLVHGFLAHARWYDFIAPQLTNLGPVYAFDMPGMGDSDHLDAYEINDYILSFQVLIDELGLKNPHLVSHSLGSLMAMNFAYDRPNLISGLIITDSPFRLESKEPDTPRRMKVKYYHSEEAIISRFRLLPDQPSQRAYVFDYIAKHSVKETEEGWRWKFDCNRETGTTDMYELWETSFERFKQLQVPSAFIYGMDSRLCTPEWIEGAKARLPDDFPFICINEAEHHLLLDQPLDFVSEVQKLIEGWNVA